MKFAVGTRITGAALFAMLTLPLQTIAQNQSAAPKHARYIVTDLGTLPGGAFSQAVVMNNAGLVGGTASPPDGTWHAALWSQEQIMDIGTPGLGGLNSQVYGVNQRSQAVGQAESLDTNGEDFCGFQAMGLPTSGTACLPFMWQDGVMTPLPTLGGSNGTASMINHRSEAVGYAENNTPDPACPAFQFKPVIWKHGKIHELPTYPGDPAGVAAWINDQGQVVGSSGTCAPFNVNSGLNLSEDHALLWEKDGTVHDLGNLGGAGGLAGNHACSINNQGQVVGHSELTDNATFHGYLWTSETGMLDLGTFPGDYASVAIGINDSGEVVGGSLDANFNERAVIWKNGAIADLNALVPANSPLYLLNANWINDVGEIVGFGVQPSSGEVHAFLATPCERNRADARWCRDDRDDASAANQATEKPPALSENARKLLLRQILHR